MRDSGSALLELNVPLCSRLDKKLLVSWQDTRFSFWRHCRPNSQPPHLPSDLPLSLPLTHQSIDGRSCQHCGGDINYQVAVMCTVSKQTARTRGLGTTLLPTFISGQRTDWAFFFLLLFFVLSWRETKKSGGWILHALWKLLSPAASLAEWVGGGRGGLIQN